jgi:hypothetical protein
VSVRRRWFSESCEHGSLDSESSEVRHKQGRWSSNDYGGKGRAGSLCSVGGISHFRRVSRRLLWRMGMEMSCWIGGPSGVAAIRVYIG